MNDVPVLERGPQHTAASEMQRLMDLSAEQEREIELLRRVYEAARAVLRYTGVDAWRVQGATEELDAAIENVKTLDAGYDEPDLLKPNAQVHRKNRRSEAKAGFSGATPC